MAVLFQSRFGRFAPVLLLSLAFFARPAVVNASPFINMDFEQAVVISNDPIFGNLDWSLALPGWLPWGQAPETTTVYYGSPHLGFGPYQILRGGPILSSRPALSGNYSLGMRGGFEPEFGDTWISQTGDIPTSARAIEFIVLGHVPEIYVGNERIPLALVGTKGLAKQYAGNVVANAGTTAELKILYPPGDGLFEEDGNDVFGGTLDDFKFTTRVIPEPSTCVLAAFALAGLLLIGRAKVG